MKSSRGVFPDAFFLIQAHEWLVFPHLQRTVFLALALMCQHGSEGAGGGLERSAVTPQESAGAG